MASGNLLAALQAIESDEEKERERAIPVLVASARPETLLALEKVARNDDNLQLRFMAKEGALKVRQALTSGVTSHGSGKGGGQGRSAEGVDLKRLKSRLGDKDPARRLRGVRSALAHRERRALKYLVKLLEREKDPSVAVELCMTIGVLGSKGHGSAMLARLQDPAPEVRRAAIKGLTYLKDPAVYPTVVAMLQDRDKGVRNRAFESLVRLGKPRLVALLVRMIQSSRRWPRKAAIRACAKINSPEFVDVLVKARARDPDPRLRLEAVKALVHLSRKGNEAASVVLEEAPPTELEQGSPDTDGLVMDRADQGAATHGRAQVPPPGAAERSTEPVPLDLPAPEPAPASPGEPAATSSSTSVSETLPRPPLDMDLEFEDEDLDDEEEESLELSTAEVMVGGLHDPDPEVRMENLKEILSQRDRSLSQQLAARLPLEEEPKVLAKLLLAVGKLGRNKDARRVARFLTAGEARVRANAVEALSMLGDEKALEQVVPLLDDEDNRTRANAVVALQGNPRVDVMQTLKAMAKHPDAQMRLSAIFAALEIGTTDVDPVLHFLLKDAEQEVKEKALSALNLLEDQRMAPMHGGGADLDSTQAHLEKLSAWRGGMVDEESAGEEPEDHQSTSKSLDEEAEELLGKLSGEVGGGAPAESSPAAKPDKNKKGLAGWGRPPARTSTLPREGGAGEGLKEKWRQLMDWLEGKSAPSKDGGAGVDDEKKRLALIMVLTMLVTLLAFILFGGGSEEVEVDPMEDF